MNKRREEKERAAQLKQTKQQLETVTQALNAAYHTFNNVSDPVILDACIYEINALRSRRNSVLHDIRNLE